MKNISFCILLLAIYLLLPTKAISQSKSTHIQGIVVDQNGIPIEKVVLQHGSDTDLSNQDGVFFLPTLGITKDQSLYFIVRKEGYYLLNGIKQSSLYEIKPSERSGLIRIQMYRVPLPLEKKVVAVLPFCDTSPKEAPLINGAFTAKAADALRQVDTSRMEMVSHGEVWFAMNRRGMNWESYCEIDEVIQLAGDVRANVVLMGMYQKTMDDRWIVSCSFVDLSRKQKLFRSISESSNDLVLLQEKMYTSILKQLGVPVTEQAEKVVKSHTTDATRSEDSYKDHLTGAQYQAQGDYQQAKKYQEKAIEKDPDNFRAYEDKAEAELELGEEDKAENSFKKAREKAKKKGIIRRIIEWISPKKRKDIAITNGETQTYTVNEVSFEMVEVEGGSFTMGCTSEQGGDCDDDEKPSHSVSVSSFQIGQTEVTQELWRAVMGKDPEELAFKGCDKCPVERVSWNDIQGFLMKLNAAATGKRFRLPTEAEWEYAARGGNKSKGYKYSGSNNVSNVAWYDGNSGSKTHPVAQKSPNELGIYDMSGNVYEWCEDDWHDNYNGAPRNGKAWVNSSRASERVTRGGSWLSIARIVRLSNRIRDFATRRHSRIGFRLVASAP